jgi:hypothetical protein
MTTAPPAHTYPATARRLANLGTQVTVALPLPVVGFVAGFDIIARLERQVGGVRRWLSFLLGGMRDPGAPGRCADCGEAG